jgi:hypothetical protein
MLGRDKNAYSNLVGKLEGKGRHGKPRRRWEDNIKIDLKEIGVRMWQKVKVKLSLCFYLSTTP